MRFNFLVCGPYLQAMNFVNKVFIIHARIVYKNYLDHGSLEVAKQ